MHLMLLPLNTPKTKKMVVKFMRKTNKHLGTEYWAGWHLLPGQFWFGGGKGASKQISVHPRHYITSPLWFIKQSVELIQQQSHSARNGTGSLVYQQQSPWATVHHWARTLLCIEPIPWTSSSDICLHFHTWCHFV